VKKVYTVDGKLVKGLDDFESGQNYICCGAEVLNLELKPLALTEKVVEEKPAEKEATPSSPTKKPTTPRKTPIQKFGLQTEKAKVIYVYANGDKHHKGVKVTLHATKFKTFDQLKNNLTKEVKISTGAVRQIFNTDGKVIKTLGEFEDGGKYIAAGAEKLDMDHCMYDIGFNDLHISRSICH